MVEKHFVLKLLLLLANFCHPSSSDWTHHVIMDREGYFHFYWTPQKETILIKIEAKTHGYLSLGFSPNGGMKGSDLYIGWIHNSEIFFLDTFAYNNSVPVKDASQDFTLLGGFQNESHTSITFSRRWNTCDQLQDLPLGGDTVRVVWAYHPDDPQDNRIIYHGHTRRGVRSLFLKEPPKLEIPVDDLQHLKHWDLRAQNTRLPNDDHTHYWCQIFKAPTLDQKHHMIGFEPIIHPGHESYLHHMVLYECHVNHDDSSGNWFERHVSTGGTACYSPNMPPEWTFCLASNAWAWAVGSEGEILPEHVGMPLGEDFGGATYFMLETHYDNPGLHKDLVDTSGIRIYYTTRLRTHDTAMLLVGSEVNFLHMIPPVQNQFTTVGRCSADCTKKGLDSDGIHIINGVLHSHLAGRQIRLRHVRDGLELPTILQDNNYDFNFQASRQPLNETHVLPGDELIMECQYQTSNRSKPTFGGLSTRDEMCLAFIIYYPRQQLADCRSLPALQTVMNALGIESIYGQAFKKLVDFMKDIDGGKTNGSKDSDTLQELIAVLAEETGRHFPSISLAQSQPPLTEEEILKRPFYSVITEEEKSEANPFQTGKNQLITDSNYRTLMADMLLSVRIKAPASLHNRTIGQHFSQMDWSDVDVSRTVEDILLHGSHSCLCLAHGRQPIIPYEEKPYPDISEVYVPPKTIEICQNLKSKKVSKSNHDTGVIRLYQEKSIAAEKSVSNLIIVSVLFMTLLNKFFK